MRFVNISKSHSLYIFVCVSLLPRANLCHSKFRTKLARTHLEHRDGDFSFAAEVAREISGSHFFVTEQDSVFHNSYLAIPLEKNDYKPVFRDRKSELTCTKYCGRYIYYIVAWIQRM